MDTEELELLDSYVAMNLLRKHKVLRSSNIKELFILLTYGAAGCFLLWADRSRTLALVFLLISLFFLWKPEQLGKSEQTTSTSESKLENKEFNMSEANESNMQDYCWFIITRNDGKDEYDIILANVNDPLYGKGSWSLMTSRAFDSFDDAEEWFFNH